MRTFIAIDLPNDIKDVIAGLQERLKVPAADVKWVAPENVHLTLKFLGEIDEAKLDKVIKIIEGSAGNTHGFQLRLSSLGAFPKINFPRVIWVGIDRGEKEAKEIAEELEEKIAKIGIPKEERSFSSHITIGRVRSAKNRDKLLKGLEAEAREFPNSEAGLEFYVSKITLFKSTLSAQGPTYEALKVANLKAS